MEIAQRAAKPASMCVRVISGSGEGRAGGDGGGGWRMTWHEGRGWRGSYDVAFGAQLQLWLTTPTQECKAAMEGRQQSGVVGEQHTKVDCAGNHQFITMIPTLRSGVGRQQCIIPLPFQVLPVPGCDL